MVAIDVNKIPADRIFDLSNPALRARFMATKAVKGTPYSRYHAMYDRIAGEGVVAIRDGIPVEAVSGLVRVRSNASAESIQQLLNLLVGGGS